MDDPKAGPEGERPSPSTAPRTPSRRRVPSKKEMMGQTPGQIVGKLSALTEEGRQLGYGARQLESWLTVNLTCQQKLADIIAAKQKVIRIYKDVVDSPAVDRILGATRAIKDIATEILDPTTVIPNSSFNPAAATFVPTARPVQDSLTNNSSLEKASVKDFSFQDSNPWSMVATPSIKDSETTSLHSLADFPPLDASDYKKGTKGPNKTARKTDKPKPQNPKRQKWKNPWDLKPGVGSFDDHLVGQPPAYDKVIEEVAPSEPARLEVPIVRIHPPANEKGDEASDNNHVRRQSKAHLCVKGAGFKTGVERYRAARHLKRRLTHAMTLGLAASGSRIHRKSGRIIRTSSQGTQTSPPRVAPKVSQSTSTAGGGAGGGLTGKPDAIKAITPFKESVPAPKVLPKGPPKKKLWSQL